MLDKYGVGQDPYCYPGSSVLRNRLDLLDEARLHQAERELSEIAVGNLPLFPPPYDLDRLQHIHRILFGDIYDWAGELRSVNIQKGDTLFCTPERIPPEAAKIVRHMQDANWYVGATQADLVRQIAEALQHRQQPALYAYAACPWQCRLNAHPVHLIPHTDSK